MQLLIRKKNVPANIAIAIFSSYAYSQLSWGNLLPTIVWQVLLTVALLLMIYDNFKFRWGFRLDILSALSLVMLLISLLWNNYDIKEYGFFVETYNIILFVYFWIVKENNRWHDVFWKMMIFWGTFYAFFTYICTLNQGFYNSVVYPMMAPMGYVQDYKAGFTAFYGTNGLYICLGICACFSEFFLNNKRKSSKSNIFVLIILIAAMQFTGKRGQFIAVVASMLVGYYFYNSDKKTGRIFKIIAGATAVVVVLYCASFFVPQLSTIINRFEEQSEKGDISTGRFLMWGRALQAFLDSPWLGKGWRWFRFSNITLSDYDVHNVFLQLLVEVGIFATIPFYVFFIYNLYKAIRLLIQCRTKEAFKDTPCKFLSFAVVYQVFFLLLCLTGTAYYQFEYMYTYLSACAIVCYYSHIFRNAIRATGVKDYELG